MKFSHDLSNEPNRDFPHWLTERMEGRSSLMTIVKIEQMKEEKEKESSGRCDKRGRPGGRSVLSATGKPPAIS